MAYTTNSQEDDIGFDKILRILDSYHTLDAATLSGLASSELFDYDKFHSYIGLLDEVGISKLPPPQLTDSAGSGNIGNINFSLNGDVSIYMENAILNHPDLRVDFEVAKDHNFKGIVESHYDSLGLLSGFLPMITTSDSYYIRARISIRDNKSKWSNVVIKSGLVDPENDYVYPGDFELTNYDNQIKITVIQKPYSSFILTNYSISWTIYDENYKELVVSADYTTNYYNNKEEVIISSLKPNKKYFVKLDVTDDDSGIKANSVVKAFVPKLNIDTLKPRSHLLRHQTNTYLTSLNYSHLLGNSKYGQMVFNGASFSSSDSLENNPSLIFINGDRSHITTLDELISTSENGAYNAAKASNHYVEDSYIVGGLNAASQATDSVIRITSNGVATKPFSTTAPRHEATAILDNNGGLHIYGGLDGSNNPSAYETLNGAVATSNPSFVLKGASGVCMPNGDFYIIGGKSTTNVQNNIIYKYDSSTDTWLMPLDLFPERYGFNELYFSPITYNYLNQIFIIIDGYYLCELRTLTTEFNVLKKLPLRVDDICMIDNKTISLLSGNLITTIEL